MSEADSKAPRPDPARRRPSAEASPEAPGPPPLHASGSTPKEPVLHIIGDNQSAVASVAGDQIYYRHYLPAGRLAALTDAGGNVVERYDYTAYGEPSFYESRSYRNYDGRREGSFLSSTPLLITSQP